MPTSDDTAVLDGGTAQLAGEPLGAFEFLILGYGDGSSGALTISGEGTASGDTTYIGHLRESDLAIDNDSTFR